MRDVEQSESDGREDRGVACDGRFDHRDAMQALCRLVPVPDIVLPYLIERMSSTETGSVMMLWSGWETSARPVHPPSLR